MIIYKNINIIYKNISMSLTVYPSHAYFLLTGLYLGKLTNFASDLIITGLVLYIVTPQIFTEDRVERAKNWCWSWFDKKRVTIDMSQLHLIENQQVILKLLEPNQKIINQTTDDKFIDFSKLPRIEIYNQNEKSPTNK
jgi:hypothetical protein